VCLFDPAAGTVTTRSAPVRLWSLGAGMAEADTAEWWANVCALVPPLLAEAGGADRIAAVAVTGMVPAVVVTDAQGRPLRRAMLQNDARAVDQIEAIRAATADLDVVTLTGSSVTQQSVGPKFLWLAEREPAIAAETRRVMGSYDWIAMALGAGPHVEQNWALESGLFDIAGDPVPLLAELARIDPQLLPPVVRSGAPVGGVSAAAAEATGLAPGTAIVAGGADHVLAAYAAGLTEAGDWLVKLGGAGDILAVSNRPVVDPRLYLDHHAVPGLWLPNGCMATSGSLLRWVQHLLGDADLGELDREAEQAVPAELICLPYFLGEKSPLHDPDLRGAFIGLHLGHTRGDVYRSCLEAVAYGMRQHLEVFGELGVELAAACVTNGGSRSLVWKQILADVLDRTLTTIAESAGASLGAAFVAAVGTNLVQDWYLPRQIVQRQARVEPHPETVARYEDGYRLFLDAQERLTPLAHGLSAGQRRPS
jgi:xylulokinase